MGFCRALIGCLVFLIAGASTAADPARGKEIYDRFCSGCHGYKGDGGAGYRGGFTPHPIMLADKEYMDRLSDEYLLLVIKKGGQFVGKNSLMPGWERRLGDDQIWDVIAHIRTF